MLERDQRLESRRRHHEACVDSASSAMDAYGGEVHATIGVQAAIHSLGATIALAAQSDERFDLQSEEVVMAQRAFDEALEQHTDAVERAHKGQAPWGEILAAAATLKQASERLRLLR